MRRFRLSTLMLLIVLAALRIALVVHYRLVLSPDGRASGPPRGREPVVAEHCPTGILRFE